MSLPGVIALVLIAVTVEQGIAASALGTWSLKSPNGGIDASISLSRGTMMYGVKVISGGESRVVVKDSPLGISLQDQDLAKHLELESATSPKEIADQYTLLHGKRLQCTNAAREIVLLLRNGSGGRLEVTFRAYNDGVAFRYRVPGAQGPLARLKREHTGFSVPQGAKFWAAPADKASTYAPGYETYYENGAKLGLAATNGIGWSFPFLFRTAEGAWALLTESAVDEHFCGTRLSSAPTNGTFSIELPTAEEGNGTGSVQPSSGLPWTMPWRVIIAGESLKTIVESTLVTDVHPPSQMTDTSWIRPGRVAWSWWSDNPSPKFADTQKKFIDLAAEMSWEYVLVDANWTIMEQGNVHDVLSYAKQKGIGALLWYNSGGPQNVVTEKPRDSLTYQPLRTFELKLLREWGVKGVKVDFFQSDKQNVMEVYHGILKDAAEQQIMVNFHGCTLPRGWERRYPHLMSMEAVRGAECYIFDAKYPAAAPVQNTILPFTRNVVGPMDFTPVTLSDNRYPHKTTWAHELALAVIFESAWLHFADRVEAYSSLPAVPKEYLKRVPVTWDETRFVEGEPGSYVVLARRKGAHWYVAGINGGSKQRELSLSLQLIIGTGEYSRALILDGSAPRELKSSSEAWSAGNSMRVAMAPFGGFVMELRAAK